VDEADSDASGKSSRWQADATEGAENLGTALVQAGRCRGDYAVEAALRLDPRSTAPVQSRHTLAQAPAPSVPYYELTRAPPGRREHFPMYGNALLEARPPRGSLDASPRAAPASEHAEMHNNLGAALAEWTGEGALRESGSSRLDRRLPRPKKMPTRCTPAGGNN